MAKIYISYSRQDIEIVDKIKNELIEYGNEIYIDQDILQPGINWQSALGDALQKSDVFLVVLTENSKNSQFVNSEIGAAWSYINYSSNEKLFIPIILDNVQIPLVIQHIQAIIGDRASIDKIIKKIKDSIDLFSGRKIALDEKKEKRKQQIEKTAASYIEDTIEGLKDRENTLSKKASTWNYIGWVSLMSGVIAAMMLFSFNINESNKILIGWAEFSYLSLKSLLIVGLLVASSKYAFTLAKSYMSESLKNADRIHAIAFGKFFLQAFGDTVDTKEVKEVFQHWNINTNSSFSELDSDKFDPKIIEAILNIANVVNKDTTKKS